MRKLVAMLLVLVLCGCTQDPRQNTSSVTPKQTELRLACSENIEGIDKIIAAFEKENPEVTVTVVKTDKNDDFSLAAKALLSGELYPSLILTDAENLNELSQYFADLSAESWINTAVANSLNEVIREGEIIAIPAEIEGIGFVYNKRIFERAGINPENINSVERLAGTAEYLSQRIIELKSEFVNLSSVFETPDEKTKNYLLNTVVAQECASSSELKEADLKMTFADAYKTLLDLQEKYSRKNSNSPEENITSGRCVITLQSHKFIEGSKEAAQDLGILPISVLGASQDSIILNVPSFWAVNKNASKEEQTAAKQFLLWLYNSETGINLSTKELGWLSPFYNNPKPSPYPLTKAVMTYAINGKTMPYVLNGIGEEAYLKITEEIGTVLNKQN